jgi:hypothetical protein
LDETEGFELEPRGSEFLPENWIVQKSDENSNEKTDKETKEITWFLNSYYHKDVPKTENILVHVQTALNDIKLS